MSAVCLGLEIVVLGARLCFGEAAPRATATAVCPVIASHAAEWQRALREERLGAPASPRTDEALAEWLILRDQARVCRAIR